MSRGGKRPGAGRPKGTQTEATKARKELAQRVAEEGVTPLEVLTTTMRDLWNEANAGTHPNIGKRMQACMLAEKVAPYLHPKLASVDNTHAGPDGGPVVTRVELVALTPDDDSED